MHRSARTLTEFAAAKAFLFVIYHGEKVMNIYSTHRYLCKFRVSIFLYSRSEKEDFKTGVIGLYKSESTCTCLELTYSWKWEGFSVINCDCCRYIYLFIYFLIKRKKNCKTIESIDQCMERLHGEEEIFFAKSKVWKSLRSVVHKLC